MELFITEKEVSKIWGRQKFAALGAWQVDIYVALPSADLVFEGCYTCKLFGITYIDFTMDNEKKFHYPCLLLWSILLNHSKRQLSKKLNCVLWIARPVLYHWATEAVAYNLDAGSIPSRKALELHFSQLFPVWVL